MIVHKKHLSRRAMLRGVGGVAIALPFLDCMHPAFAAEPVPALRFAVTYYPHGVVPAKWNPSGEGKSFQLSPGLAPLEPFKDRLAVIAGLSARVDKELPEFHDRGQAALFTGCEAGKNGVNLGPSVDQLIAAKLEGQTQFGSIQTSGEGGGGGRPFYRNATTQLPTERNPRKVFERLFGDGGKVDAQATAARYASQKSALDMVQERIAALKGQIGPGDKQKLDQYLDSIRDVERQISVAQSRQLPDLPNAERPPGEGVDWEENVRLHIDVHTLAWQADLTRVIGFMMQQESTNTTFQQIGVAYGHHEASHHNYDPDKVEALHKINVLQSKLFAYWLAKLDAIKEPNGSLLDNSIMVFSSGLSNPTVHSQRDVPVMIAGKGAGKIRTGFFKRLPGDVSTWDGSPPGSTGPHNSTANLWLSIMDKYDLHMDRMGDSSHRITELDV